MTALIALVGCGGRLSDEAAGASGGTAGPTGSPSATTGPTTPAAPFSAPPRTLEEFRAALVGVWEGNSTEWASGLARPRAKVRIELTADGHYIGACLESYVPDLGTPCSAIPFFWDGPSPYLTWQIDRLTAGYEGMGKVEDSRDPSYAYRLLHRLRLSADGKQLQFTALQSADDDSGFQYSLTRVSR
jgi:hypothetical protein